MRREFIENLFQIVRDDPRYELDAYLFLREALDLSVRLFDKPAQGPARHVTGRELLEAIRQHALNEYGPMALCVLNSWGVKTTADFGNIVFNLVERGLLGKTDEDKKEDFRGCYDFVDAFEKPYLPPAPSRPPAPRRVKRRSSGPSADTL